MLVDPAVPQRSYFPFLNYAYELDVTLQQTLLPDWTPLEAGLAESLEWYMSHRELIRVKPLLAYIDEHIWAE